MWSKGQMEIMGLAMVVILIALAFLFAVIFFIGREDTPALQRARDRVFAENWVHTTLGTTTEFRGQTVRELIQRCVRGTQSHCTEARKVIGEISEDTLEILHPNYNLLLLSNEQEAMTFGTPCKGEQVVGFQEIPVFGFDVLFQLNLCV